MSRLHIVQGGLDNGDYAWLQKAHRSKLAGNSWVVPKTALPGDEVVIFVRSLGFAATAIVKTLPEKRKDWAGRYGAAIGDVKLITPPISLGLIRARLPKLTWAVYPRSITTPTPDLAQEIRALISKRRLNGVADVKADEVDGANLGELRILAAESGSKSTRTRATKQTYRLRSMAVRRYALLRSNGCCEHCGSEAPFYTAEGEPFLEVHHITQLADEGPDLPENVIALCPNCHREAHHSADAAKVNGKMKAVVRRIERSLASGR